MTKRLIEDLPGGRAISGIREIIESWFARIGEPLKNRACIPIYVRYCDIAWRFMCPD